jgi:phosphate:Na+ symporter
VIRFEAAAALVLGENVGTTITALLASIGASINAKRAAYAHTIFNVLGVIWITAIFPIYIAGIKTVLGVGADGVIPDVTKGIALTHSGFNIVNTLLFLPLMPVLARIVRKLAPDPARREVPHLTHLDVRMLDAPSIGIEQSRDEIIRMGDGVVKMLGYVGEIMSNGEGHGDKQKKVFHREEVLDVMQKEIVEFLSHLLSGSVPLDVVARGRQHLRMADEFESISDYVVDILKLHLKMKQSELSFGEEEKAQLGSLHGQVAAYVGMIHGAVQDDHADVITKARSEGDAVTHTVKNSRDKHLAHFANSHSSPLSSLVFTDMLTAYRRVKDHALNIAETLAGEK